MGTTTLGRQKKDICIVSGVAKADPFGGEAKGDDLIFQTLTKRGHASHA